MMAGYTTAVMMTNIFLDQASLLVDIISRIIIFKHIDIRLGCLGLDVDLKITASSLPTCRQRKRVKEG